MRRKISLLIFFALLVFALPPAGIYLSGRSVGLFLSFPLLTASVAHRSFSWLVFLLYLLPSAGVIALVAVAASSKPAEAEAGFSPVKRSLPWWGWVALAGLVISWLFAWTRLPWLAASQRFTFIPLWLSYIFLVNALCFRQAGTCPLLHESVFFLGLFPLSAVFWWLFEYLNQFVHNWLYAGVDHGPLAYSIHATISFCTVLPAVYTTRTWICGLKWFRRRFHGLPYGRARPGNFIPWITLGIACAGLFGVGLWPEELFSLLWLAPLLILISLKTLAGLPTLFTSLVNGDWRPAVSAAAAALLCGFLWEMWNFYSLAKWMYGIPYVYRFKIFAMPILGYMGYLPFGLLCIEVIESFKCQGSVSQEKR